VKDQDKIVYNESSLRFLLNKLEYMPIFYLSFICVLDQILKIFNFY